MDGARADSVSDTCILQHSQMALRVLGTALTSRLRNPSQWLGNPSQWLGTVSSEST